MVSLPRISSTNPGTRVTLLGEPPAKRHHNARKSRDRTFALKLHKIRVNSSWTSARGINYKYSSRKEKSNATKLPSKWNDHHTSSYQFPALSLRACRR